ncbi:MULTISPECIES: hypothetical protein [Nocardiopsis]|uniref:Uncharacterized protein n=1 Tax=Nocardiopsis sinuspersici TaxID=501010 RepID=A0A1V3C642_9ACTN|nr:MULTISPECIES: hypothetical protein [Nocardiopsis]OOC56237.1 hypothetical protein NOSIN_22415 [Nocardiopsis sinuspersici]
MERDVAGGRRICTGAGTRQQDSYARDGGARPVYVLRARLPVCWLFIKAGIAVVATLAVSEVVTALVGTPLHARAPFRLRSHGFGDPWTDPEVMIASALLMALGLTLASVPLLPSRGDWVALTADGLRPVDGVPRPHWSVGNTGPDLSGAGRPRGAGSALTGPGPDRPDRRPRHPAG